jgi:hypothetical protein
MMIKVSVHFDTCDAMEITDLLDFREAIVNERIESNRPGSSSKRRQD